MLNLILIASFASTAFFMAIFKISPTALQKVLDYADSPESAKDRSFTIWFISFGLFGLISLAYSFYVLAVKDYYSTTYAMFCWFIVFGFIINVFTKFPKSSPIRIVANFLFDIAIIATASYNLYHITAFTH